MIKKIGKHLKKRKVKIFSIFLLVSSLAWFINKLSETYTSSTTFKLNYINIPEGYLLKSVSKEKLDVKLQAIGFQFLSFGLSAKEIVVDLSKEEVKNSNFSLSVKQIQKQVERALPNSMVLKDLDKERIDFKLVKIITKPVSINANIKLTLQKNCMLDGAIVLEPSTIEVTGPENKIDTLESLKTVLLELSNIGEDFSKTIKIITPKSFKNTTYSVENVIVKGNVSRFSEKIINNIPIRVINLPKDTIVKIFPDRVKILCKAKLEVLKKIAKEDFVVTANYNNMLQGKEKVSLKVTSTPNEVYSATLLEKKVTYIISKQ
ncbi:YbbR-like protein [Maribacter vaceletii]|uniref:YbbR-like protein n=1 Tax=Maribacter vaceletii TaxID=1206816 RepID=A0A495EA48_9FLAO|nr:YbbR-like domain-containing protein [Maribacter vaceletii]RKR13383.1 YbbR-like protein [Maribacter vaceletii]